MLNFFYLSIYSIFFILHVIFFRKRLSISIELLIYFFLIIFFGLRYSVGGDFHNYESSFYQDTQNIRNYEIVFSLIIKIFLNLKIDFVVFNVLHVAFFGWSLRYFFKFFFNQNAEFLFIISFPIIFLILGIGSIRQGLAFVFFLFFLTISNKNYVLKILFFIFPVLIHKSSIFLNIIYLVPFVLFHLENNLFFKNFLKKHLIFILLLSSLFLIFLLSNYQIYFRYYILDNTYYSIGFYPRWIICFFFSIIIILLNKKKSFMDKYFFFSSLVCLVLFFVSFFSTTVADRFLLYIFPLVFYAINIILNLIKNQNKNLFFKIMFFLIFFIYLFLWENFSSNYYLWDNYENYFL